MLAKLAALTVAATVVTGAGAAARSTLPELGASLHASTTALTDTTTGMLADASRQADAIAARTAAQRADRAATAAAAAARLQAIRDASAQRAEAARQAREARHRASAGQ